MKLKGRSIDMVMLQAMGPREEASRGGEEMNHGTLWYSKWSQDLKRVEVSGPQGSFWPGVFCCIRIK